MRDVRGLTVRLVRAPRAGDWVIVSHGRRGTEGRDVAVFQVERLEQHIGEPLLAVLSDGSSWDVKTHMTPECDLRRVPWRGHHARVASASDLRANIRSSLGRILLVADVATLATLYGAVLAADTRGP